MEPREVNNQEQAQQRATEAKGQSLVEMSFILPLLLILLFGIIDIGYYVYCYATIYQAVRRGSDMAAYLPPYPSRLEGAYDSEGAWHDGWYDTTDLCVNTIITSTRKGAYLVDLNNLETDRSKFAITYLPGPGETADPDDDNPRATGKSVQVAITYTVEPLTPLYSLLPMTGDGTLTVKAVSLRTIQEQGVSLPVPGYGTVLCRDRED